jgi:hypothetical protein
MTMTKGSFLSDAHFQSLSAEYPLFHRRTFTSWMRITSSSSFCRATSHCRVLKDPEAQVIAKAIAAYATNNKARQASLNLPPVSTSTFPAITMIGSNPIFYRVTVSAGLSIAVQQGTRPSRETRVLRSVPVLPKRHGLGLRPLENRAGMLACLEAFIINSS